MIKTQQYSISYDVMAVQAGTVDRYLKRKTAKFATLREAMDFARSVANTQPIVGKPMLKELK